MTAPTLFLSISKRYRTRFSANVSSYNR